MSFSVKQEVRTTALLYMQTHGLLKQGWSIEVNNSKRTLGSTDYDNKIITISKVCYYLDGELIDTILHEIAHVIAGYEANHNSLWRDIALNIGCSGKVCGHF